MIKENCSLIGTISKSHGISGQLMLRLNGDFADDIEPGEPLFVEVDEILVPFFIEEAEVFPDRAVVKLEFISNPREGKKFTGKKVYLEKSFLKSRENLSVENGKFFIGYSIHDKTSGTEGVIREFIDNPLNPLFLVVNETSEFLIPVNPVFILDADNEKKFILFELPEGLVNI